MLELQNVSVGFDAGLPAIAEIDLALAERQRLLVCGAAGSGKSTLLGVAAGLVPRLVRPQSFSGKVSLGGRPLTSYRKDELFSAVGLVSQNVEDHLWDLGVEDLIAFPLENRAREKMEIRGRVAALMGMMEIDALRGRRVLTLSGGERRMVAIAAALAAWPRLLVLDEPTTGLDPAARERLVAALNALAGETPALLVTEQDPASVSATADSVALLTGGRLEPVHALAELMPKDEAWLRAGILPPYRHRRRHVAHAPGAPLLQVSALRSRLARATGEPVLAEVGLEIRAGEVVGLIGRNGAGKTTLFQAILGLAPVQAGKIVIGGEDARDWTPARRARAIAYLPQNMRRILFNMTALEEVVFAVTAGARPDTAATEAAKAALARYGLAGLAEANPFALSARQQALLGLACADAAGSGLAILDEPLLARDVEGRRLLEQFLTGMTDAGRAVMLISHDLDLVDDVASRLLILESGRIGFDGRPRDAWHGEAFRNLGWQAPGTRQPGAAA